MSKATDALCLEMERHLAHYGIPARVVHECGEGYAVIRREAPNAYGAVHSLGTMALAMSAADLRAFVAGACYGARVSRAER